MGNEQLVNSYISLGILKSWIKNIYKIQPETSKGSLKGHNQRKYEDGFSFGKLTLRRVRELKTV